MRIVPPGGTTCSRDSEPDGMTSVFTRTYRCIESEAVGAATTATSSAVMLTEYAYTLGLNAGTMGTRRSPLATYTTRSDNVASNAASERVTVIVRVLATRASTAVTVASTRVRPIGRFTSNSRTLASHGDARRSFVGRPLSVTVTTVAPLGETSSAAEVTVSVAASSLAAAESGVRVHARRRGGRRQRRVESRRQGVLGPHRLRDLDPHGPPRHERRDAADLEHPELDVRPRVRARDFDAVHLRVLRVLRDHLHGDDVVPDAQRDVLARGLVLHEHGIHANRLRALVHHRGHHLHAADVVRHRGGVRVHVRVEPRIQISRAKDEVGETRFRGPRSKHGKPVPPRRDPVLRGDDHLERAVRPVEDPRGRRDVRPGRFPVLPASYLHLYVARRHAPDRPRVRRRVHDDALRVRVDLRDARRR
eukprot:30957-Pelagococcus_subviridis.AAC.69